MENTKEIIVPSGKKIVIKSMLSYNDLQCALKIEDNTDRQTAILKIAVLSVEGVVEQAYDKICALPIADYIAIAKEVAAIVTGNFPQAK